MTSKDKIPTTNKIQLPPSPKVKLSDPKKRPESNNNFEQEELQVHAVSLRPHNNVSHVDSKPGDKSGTASPGAATLQNSLQLPQVEFGADPESSLQGGTTKQNETEPKSTPNFQSAKAGKQAFESMDLKLSIKEPAATSSEKLILPQPKSILNSDKLNKELQQSLGVEPQRPKSCFGWFSCCGSKTNSSSRGSRRNDSAIRQP